MKLLLLITSVTVLSAVPSGANITLSVDHIKNTLKITGTISGTTDQFGTIQFIGFPGGDFNGGEFFSISSGITSSFEVSDATLFSDDYAESDAVGILFDFGAANGNETRSLAGNGTLINYELSSTYESILEDLAAANTVLPLGSGSTEGTLTLRAVPEPAAYATLLGLCCAVLVFCRRRSR